MIDSLNKLLSEREKQIANDAATRMRDRCVAKVREMGDEWRRQANSREEFQFANDRLKRSAQANAADWIITALQSLTLEVEENSNENTD